MGDPAPDGEGGNRTDGAEASKPKLKVNFGGGLKIKLGAATAAAYGVKPATEGTRGAQGALPSEPQPSTAPAPELAPINASVSTAGAPGGRKRSQGRAAARRAAVEGGASDGDVVVVVDGGGRAGRAQRNAKEQVQDRAGRRARARKAADSDYEYDDSGDEDFDAAGEGMSSEGDEMDMEGVVESESGSSDGGESDEDGSGDEGVEESKSKGRTSRASRSTRKSAPAPAKPAPAKRAPRARKAAMVVSDSDVSSMGVEVDGTDEEGEEESGGGRKGRGAGRGRARQAASAGGGAASTASGRGKKGRGGGGGAGKGGGARGGGGKAGGGGRFFRDNEDGVDTEDEDDEEGHGCVDYSHLDLKPDHPNRPMWVLPDARVILESQSPIYRQAYDFLIAIAEPLTRPDSIHEYRLTPHSLYAAVSVGLTTQTIVEVLQRMSKVGVPPELSRFIHDSTVNFGKVKVVLKHNRFWVESPDKAVLDRLARDSVIQSAMAGEKRVIESGRALREHAAIDLTKEAVDAVEGGRGGSDEEGEEAMGARGAGVANASATQEQQRQYEGYDIQEGEEVVWAFEIAASQVERVKQRCLPDGLNFPMLEEYDFKNDRVNPTLQMDLRPQVRLRPYQEKCLSKMFGNGRARSGIVVLPCGAGKTLTGIAAATRIKKSVMVLCKNTLAVEQWAGEFLKWSTLPEFHVAKFTAEDKRFFPGACGVLITTYTMMTGGEGKKSEESERVMQMIRSMEWGLLILDEVHVAPADDFRKSFGIIKSHCKLGLTATLVREDSRINDLHFLIGPKLYEANWSDLAKEGHIATVECLEIWCPMTAPFFREYLKSDSPSLRQRLWVCNPVKYMMVEFLMRTHEELNHRTIVFSDNIFALLHMQKVFNRNCIYGKTSQADRMQILEAFKTGKIKTLLLSKVGDDSIDIPDANVIIQVASHGASRRQEAQRLGRILRRKAAGKVSRVMGVDSVFYSLVSRDTREMYFSVKRQRFLVDQGYSYRVLDYEDYFRRHPTYRAKLQQTRMAKPENRQKLLEDVLREEIVGDGAKATKQGAGGVRRVVGSLATLTGADDMHYAEYARDADAAVSGAKRQAQTAPVRAPAKRHKIFRQLYAGKK